MLKPGGKWFKDIFLNLRPRVKEVKLAGRWSKSWSNLESSLNSNDSRVDGKWFKDWLNSRPRVKFFNDGGRWSKGWLNLEP